MVVKQALKKLGHHYIMVDLGEVEIIEDLNSEQKEQLRAALHKVELELMDDKKSVLIENIKRVIIELKLLLVNMHIWAGLMLYRQ